MIFTNNKSVSNVTNDVVWTYRLMLSRHNHPYPKNFVWRYYVVYVFEILDINKMCDIICIFWMNSLLSLNDWKNIKKIVLNKKKKPKIN